MNYFSKNLFIITALFCLLVFSHTVRAEQTDKQTIHETPSPIKRESTPSAETEPTAVISPTETPADSNDDIKSTIESLQGTFTENLAAIGIEPERKMNDNEPKPEMSLEAVKNKPTHIIRLQPDTLNEESEATILNTLQQMREKNKKITYYDTVSNLSSFYLFLYQGDRSDEAILNGNKIDTTQMSISRNRLYKPAYTPNDPEYSSQWHLPNISWAQAMDAAVNPQDVTVALIDNGVDMSDQDLDGKLWTNTAETADGTDSDGNGYIDDVHGCNIYRHRHVSAATACADASMSDAGSKHGSYVASVMAAEVNNAYGAASVCPNCKLMVLDVDDGGGAYLSDIVFALDYAVAKQAKIINFSYISACPFDDDQDLLSADINEVVNVHNVSFVQAAGNNGGRSTSQCSTDCSGNQLCTGTTHQEAYYYSDGKTVPNKITVSSTNSINGRTSFTHYDGNNKVLSIAAPGINIVVTDNGNPLSITGTSFSAPQVSGGLAFFAGAMSANGKSITSADLYTLLRSTADTIYTDKDISGKKLNLYNLVSLAQQSGYPVYRFWSDQKQGHFYTISPAEREHVIQNYDDFVWRYEGIAYNAFQTQAEGTTPVYRFWSDRKQGHFYVYPLSYSGSSQTVYRFWSDQKQHHFYTASEAEKDYVIDTYDNYIWKYEGEAWKVVQ